MELPISVIFICYENICRSPMAEGIFSSLLDRYGLLQCFKVASAGTVPYQTGALPDQRAIDVLYSRGIDISPIRAQCITDLDMDGFDWIFTMDHEIHEEVSSIFISYAKPRLHMMMDFVEERASDEIRDPYYGTVRDFELVMNNLHLASERILHVMFEQYPDLAYHASRIN
jgi:protein-tyrosine phosphatase